MFRQCNSIFCNRNIYKSLITLIYIIKRKKEITTFSGCISQMSKKGMKPLISSLRESNRYIAFEVLSKIEVKDFDKVRDSMELEFRNFLGDLTLAKSGLIILRENWNSSSQRGVIKVEKKYSDHFKGALCMVEKIGNIDVVVRSLITSGMINRVKKSIIGG